MFLCSLTSSGPSSPLQNSFNCLSQFSFQVFTTHFPTTSSLNILFKVPFVSLPSSFSTGNIAFSISHTHTHTHSHTHTHTHTHTFGLHSRLWACKSCTCSFKTEEELGVSNRDINGLMDGGTWSWSDSSLFVADSRQDMALMAVFTDWGGRTWGGLSVTRELALMSGWFIGHQRN